LAQSEEEEKREIDIRNHPTTAARITGFDLSRFGVGLREPGIRVESNAGADMVHGIYGVCARLMQEQQRKW